ncbi:UNVERIFIED_CONTAM: hypothetical protein NCL1_32642 [Trichonephila clavipes]
MSSTTSLKNVFELEWMKRNSDDYLCSGVVVAQVSVWLKVSDYVRNLVFSMI